MPPADMDNEDGEVAEEIGDRPPYEMSPEEHIEGLEEDLAEVKDALDGIRSRLTWILIFIVGALVYAFFR